MNKFSVLQKIFYLKSSAYRSGYNTNQVSIQLTENWRTALDNNFFSGAVLMDLSKLCDCIPLNPLIAKLHADGLSFDSVIFLSAFPKDQKLSFLLYHRAPD